MLGPDIMKSPIYISLSKFFQYLNVQRQVFYQQTGLNQRHAQKDEQQYQPQHKKHEQHDDDFGDEFSHQLELQLIEEEQLQQK